MAPRKKADEETITTTVRLSKEVHEKVVELSREEERSLNWTISDLLKRALGIGKKGKEAEKGNDQE